MRREGKPFVALGILASAIVGVGISLIEWGDPDGVHGTGLPTPISISGIPEDSPAAILGDFSVLGIFAFLLNILFVLVAAVFVWAVMKLIRRLFFRD